MSENVSVISRDAVMSGEFSINGTIDVSGLLAGTIVADCILVKDDGNINGDIFATEVVVSKGGRIQGNIMAKSLKLSKGAEVVGKINYSTLSIEDGAKINCTCEIINEDDVFMKIGELRQQLEETTKE